MKKRASITLNPNAKQPKKMTRQTLKLGVSQRLNRDELSIYLRAVIYFVDQVRQASSTFADTL